MPGNDEPTTSYGLLSLLQIKSTTGWSRFTEIYSPIVYGWARRAGLQDTDAADITQEVFRSVVRGIGGFENRTTGSFRGWLWTITRNHIRMWFRKQQRTPTALGGTNHGLEQLPDWTDSEIVPNESAVRDELIRRAARAVQSDFAPKTWQAFWRATVDGHTSTEIAHDLGMTTNAVRQARFRVLTRLRDFVEIG